MKIIGVFFIGIFICSITYSQSKKVLFVCEHGSAKSVIASVYFNKLAKERNLPWEAITRGTDPEEALSANTEKGLIKDKVLVTKIVPTRVSQKDVTNAEQIILFYPLPANIQTKSKPHFWNNLPPVSEDYEKARDAIVIRVTLLLDSLTTH